MKLGEEMQRILQRQRLCVIFLLYPDFHPEVDQANSLLHDDYKDDSVEFDNLN